MTDETKEWTESLPQVPGHYWVRHKNQKARVVQLIESKSRMDALTGLKAMGTIVPVENMRCKWQGPIHPVEEK